MAAGDNAAMLPESRFYRAVRQYVTTAPSWAADLIAYETKPDEARDLTLVSQRVYGNRNEFLAVMAAAGLDRFDQVLPSGLTLRMPSASRLLLLKESTGYQSTDTVQVR